MPAQIRFPILDWCALKHVVSGFEEFRLVHVNVWWLEQVDLFEVIAPLPIRRQLLELAYRHFVVIFLRIAQLDACSRGFCELCLKRENFLCVIGSSCSWLAEQRQHFRDMIDILIAQFLGGFIRLCVVIAIRHAEPALNSLGDLVRTVLGVLARRKIEKCIDADRVQTCDFFEQIIAIFDRVNVFELVLQGFCAHCLDRFLVHSTGVVIADLLHFRRESWIDMCIYGFFGNDVQRVIVPLDQLVETTPARIFRRNLCPFDPTAVRIHKKIILRFYRRIHVLWVQWRRILFDLAWRLSA